jgi:hypothetical protein
VELRFRDWIIFRDFQLTMEYILELAEYFSVNRDRTHKEHWRQQEHWTNPDGERLPPP